MAEMADGGGAVQSASEPLRRPLTRWQLGSYGAAAMPLALAGIPLALYLPQIYAGDYALNLAIVGVVLMLIRVTDVITDPIIGIWSDRVRTRWGRRKPFVLIGTPIYMASAWFLFFPPFEFFDVTWLGATFSIGYVWLAAMLFIVYLGSTIKNIPYGAWGAELALDYNERSRIFGWREQFGVTGSLLAAFTPAAILFFGYTSPLDAVWFLIMGMMVLMLPLTINTVVAVPEYPPIERRAEKLTLGEMWQLVKGNRPYVMLVLIFAVSAVGTQMTNSLSLFFVSHVLLAGQLYGLYLFPYFVCQVAALPLWMRLSRRIGKHRATMVAIGWYSVWSLFIPLIAMAPGEWFTAFEIPRLAAFFSASMAQEAATYFEGIPTGKFLFFIVIMCLKGSSIGALAALPNAMLADVVDLDSARSGKQQAGAFFSIWSMVSKSALALGVLVGTGLAAWFGFDPKADPMNTTNTTFALLMLAVLYSIVPAIFKFVAMPFLWNYPLTETRVREIQQEMKAGA
jgi:Na+/melibiose symporter-like transporter